MWGWNVVQLDMACVVDGMLVWVQLHSKEAIARFHLKFHRWNVKIFVNQLGERREGGQPGRNHHQSVVHVSRSEESGNGVLWGVGLQVLGVAQTASARDGPRLFVDSHDH